MIKILNLTLCFIFLIIFISLSSPSMAGVLDFMFDKYDSFNSMQLCQAIRKNQFKRAKKLLESNPYLANRMEVVHDCNPPLHEAVGVNRPAFVREILKYVKDINAKWEGKTALELAKELEHPETSEIVIILREHGASDNPPTSP